MSSLAILTFVICISSTSRAWSQGCLRFSSQAMFTKVAFLVSILRKSLTKVRHGELHRYQSQFTVIWLVHLNILLSAGPDMSSHSLMNFLDINGCTFSNRSQRSLIISKLQKLLQRSNPGKPSKFCAQTMVVSMSTISLKDFALQRGLIYIIKFHTIRNRMVLQNRRIDP